VLQEAEGNANTDDAVDSGNRTKVYSLSVVRLANPQHAQLALINVTDSTQAVHTVCASTAQVSPTAYLPQPESAEDDSGAGGDSPSSGVPSCDPDTPLGVNVSSETKWVSLQPGLLYPDVDGIRVEVKGQVLSQGGDVGADQIAVTSGRSNSSSRYMCSSCMQIQTCRCVQLGPSLRFSELEDTNPAGHAHSCCQQEAGASWEACFTKPYV